MPLPQQRSHSCGSHAVCRFEQLCQLRCTVVRGDIARFVTEQDLSRLKRHTCSSKPAPEGVLEIVHTHLVQARFATRALPSAVVHELHGLATVAEHELTMLAATGIDYRLRRLVQHHQPILPILNSGVTPPSAKVRGYHEHGYAKLGHTLLPGPAKLHHLLLPQAGVDLEQRHAGQVLWQSRKQPCLLFS